MPELSYFVILWGIASCRVEGPFGEFEDAKSWLDDHSFADDDDHESGLVTQLPNLYTRSE